MAGKKLKTKNLTKFNVPCAFGGQASEVAIFIGAPESKHNPIHFQAKFIQDVRGGVIPQSVFESLEKLQKLSIENGVPFEELCRYALGSIESDQKNAIESDHKNNTTINNESDKSEIPAKQDNTAVNNSNESKNQTDSESSTNENNQNQQNNQQ